MPYVCIMKLFLYSLELTREHACVLNRLAGKDPCEMSFALIENAADIIPNRNDWLGGFRDMLKGNGYQLERIDLQKWCGKEEKLKLKLATKDVIWLGGGHTYYLRWILRQSHADIIIRDLVRQGTIYAGWSAGAVVAGPTTQYFDKMGDDPNMCPQLINEGLNLTNYVVVPHMDNKDFYEGADMTNQLLRKAGYQTIRLGDSQALVIDGEHRKVI
jgi:dipeptidase E